MTKIEVAEGYDNFSNMARWPTHFAEFEKLPRNPNFIQISQAFPLASLDFIKQVCKVSSTNSASSTNVQI